MITTGEVLKSLCGSVLRANADYARLSGGLHIQESGIEPYVSSVIAAELVKLGRKKDGDAFAMLELGPLKIHDMSGATSIPGRRPNSMRASGRVDVTYFDRNRKPIGLIEVKRHFSWSALTLDVQRIRELLRRCGPQQGGSIRWGAVVGFHAIYPQTRKGVDDRVAAFEAKFLQQFDDLKSTRCVQQKSARNINPYEKVADAFVVISTLFKYK